MAVDVEVRLVSVHALANKICHPANREDVARSIQRETISRIQADPGQHFFVNRPKTWIVGLEGMHLGRFRRHPFDDIKNVRFFDAVGAYRLTTTRSWIWEYSSSESKCRVTNWWVLA